jgi:hypothetical protein
MTSEDISRRSVRTWTRLGVFSFTSSIFRFFSFPRLCCCARHSADMLFIEFIICPISFEFLFFLLISFSKSCSRAEFFSDIYVHE